MKGKILKLLLVITASVVLAACGSNKSKTDSAQTRASVEDRSASGADVAASQGLADDGAAAGGALNDPNSPLAVRVIYFDYDSANIRADFNETVAAHASYLAANPNTIVTIEGHADERGSREYNLALGEHRSLAVRKQLVLLGASAAQIKTVSYGEERPAVDGHDDSAYSQNRRAELVY